MIAVRASVPPHRLPGVTMAKTTRAALTLLTLPLATLLTAAAASDGPATAVPNLTPAG